MDVLDRVFGSCFRSWGVKENVGDTKYIDYLPTRKWKYSDHNLMKDLSENNPSDVMDLADDSQGQTSSNIKLRLHDNVFLNPLNESSRDVVNESLESEEIIMEHTPQLISEENNNTIDSTDDEERKISHDSLLPGNEKCETVDVENQEKSPPTTVDGDGHSEEDSERKLSHDPLLPGHANSKAVVGNDVPEEKDSPVTIDGKCSVEAEEAAPDLTNGGSCVDSEEDASLVAINDNCSAGIEEGTASIAVNGDSMEYEKDSSISCSGEVYLKNEETISQTVINDDICVENEEKRNSVSAEICTNDGKASLLTPGVEEHYLEAEPMENVEGKCTVDVNIGLSDDDDHDAGSDDDDENSGTINSVTNCDQSVLNTDEQTIVVSADSKNEIPTIQDG